MQYLDHGVHYMFPHDKYASCVFCKLKTWFFLLLSTLDNILQFVSNVRLMCSIYN